MKRILIMSFTLLLVVVAAAAEHDFNPRRFQADMETFIVKEAGLTPHGKEAGTYLSGQA